MPGPAQADTHIWRGMCVLKLTSDMYNAWAGQAPPWIRGHPIYMKQQAGQNMQLMLTCSL